MFGVLALPGLMTMVQAQDAATQDDPQSLGRWVLNASASVPPAGCNMVDDEAGICKHLPSAGCIAWF
jgi:hypothetical protein